VNDQSAARRSPHSSFAAAYGSAYLSARRKGVRASVCFIERDPDEADRYLSEELARRDSRERLIESMESLLRFTKKASFQWDRDWEALVLSSPGVMIPLNRRPPKD
jgi:hypothetical protein